MTTRVFWSAFLLLGGAAFGVGFFPAAATRIAWYVGAGYWLLALAFLTFALAIISAVRGQRPSGGWLRRWLGEYAVAVILAAAIVAAYAWQLPPRFRVLSDEAYLLGTSLSLYHDHTPILATKALFDGQGEYLPYEVRVDKRALGFPFLLYLTHALTGYRVENAFALNLLLGVTALLAFYALGRCWFGRNLSLAGMFLFGSFPAWAFAVSSAGFEVANVLFLQLTVLFAVRAERSGDRHWVFLVLASATLALQMRYESVLLAAPLAGWVLWRYGRRPSAAFSPTWLVFPLLLLPFAWHQAVEFQHEVVPVAGTGYFSIANFRDNAIHARDFFLFSSPLFGSSPLVAALALMGIPVALYAAIAKPRGNGVAIVATLGLLGICSVIFSFWGGNFMYPVTTRLAIVLFPMLALLALALLQRLQRRLPWLSAAAVGLALALFVANLPAVGKSSNNLRLVHADAYDAVLDEFELRYRGRHVLILSQWASWFLVRGHSALGVDDYVNKGTEIRSWLRDKDFDTIVAIETYYHYRDAHNAYFEPGIGKEFDLYAARMITPDLAIRWSELNRDKLSSASSEPAPQTPVH